MHYRKIGGIHWIAIGPLRLSFCITRKHKPTRPARIILPALAFAATACAPHAANPARWVQHSADGTAIYASALSDFPPATDWKVTERAAPDASPRLIGIGCDGAGGDLWADAPDALPHCRAIEEWR